MSIIILKYFVHIFDFIKKIVWAATFLVLKKKIQKDTNFWMSPLKMCVSPKSSNDSKETHMVWPPFLQPCRNMSTHSATAPKRTSALWPRQGQSQRLVSQCLQNLTTYNWIPFCFGSGQCTYQPLSWMMTPRALLGLQRPWEHSQLSWAADRVTEATTKVNWPSPSIAASCPGTWKRQ